MADFKNKRTYFNHVMTSMENEEEMAKSARGREILFLMDKDTC